MFQPSYVLGGVGMIFVAYAAAWISCSAAVIAGIYLTKSPWCLLALYFVARLKIEQRSSDKEEREDGTEENE